MNRSEERLNPHNWLSRLGKPPLDRWECRYCHAIGTYDELRAVACAYEYPPCPHCGQTPECALDCPGIAAALSSPDVHVAGTIDPTRCVAARDDVELGGPRCQELATHRTLFGRRCARHAEELRQTMRDPNTLGNVIAGVRTEEQIARVIVELPKGEQPS